MAREEPRGGKPARRRRAQVINRDERTPQLLEASRRSDKSIEEEISELLTRHPDLDTSDLEVHVEGGEVTLSGRVEDRDARWLAEDLLESISGVSLVHNQLRVSRG